MPLLKPDHKTYTKLQVLHDTTRTFLEEVSKQGSESKDIFDKFMTEVDVLCKDWSTSTLDQVMAQYNVITEEVENFIFAGIPSVHNLETSITAYQQFSNKYELDAQTRSSIDLDIQVAKKVTEWPDVISNYRDIIKDFYGNITFKIESILTKDSSATKQEQSEFDAFKARAEKEKKSFLQRASQLPKTMNNVYFIQPQKEEKQNYQQESIFVVNNISPEAPTQWHIDYNEAKEAPPSNVVAYNPASTTKKESPSNSANISPLKINGNHSDGDESPVLKSHVVQNPPSPLNSDVNNNDLPPPEPPNYADAQKAPSYVVESKPYQGILFQPQKPLPKPVLTSNNDSNINQVQVKAKPSVEESKEIMNYALKSPALTFNNSVTPSKDSLIARNRAIEQQYLALDKDIQIETKRIPPKKRLFEDAESCAHLNKLIAQQDALADEHSKCTLLLRTVYFNKYKTLFEMYPDGIKTKTCSIM